MQHSLLLLLLLLLLWDRLCFCHCCCYAVAAAVAAAAAAESVIASTDCNFSISAQRMQFLLSVWLLLLSLPFCIGILVAVMGEMMMAASCELWLLSWLLLGGAVAVVIVCFCC